MKTLSNKTFYFAYGSNMSEKRMIDRGVDYKDRFKGILNNYKFTINKKSYKDPLMGFANIIKSDSDIVEGIIYELEENDIKKLDKFEGFPKHYDRIKLFVDSDRGMLECIVYVATEKWVVEKELKTTTEYKKFIIDGKDLLSKEYVNKLNENIKV